MKPIKTFDVTIVGGGMITAMQILPSLYHIQRWGMIRNIGVCGRSTRPLAKLAHDNNLKTAFPGSSFTSYPDIEKESTTKRFPNLHKEVIAKMKPRNIGIIALPDQAHYEAVMHALKHDQHVICVKPLTLKYVQTREIAKLAYEKGLFVGVEYHKRFDDRVGIARLKYRNGDLGEFRMGYATLIEPWYYRDSNFQQWCTAENSDMFTYIGCHYIDQVHLITGLLPVRISVYGTLEKYPNGNEGYLWTNARVIWENGASLSILNGMGYPNVAPGGNSQGLWMFTQGEQDGGLVFHDDQYRGLKHSYVTKGTEPGASFYNEPSPDYFKLVERGGEGLTPVGYGYRSIEALVHAVQRVENCAQEPQGPSAISKQQQALKTIDAEGVIATPSNSSFNELVIEAGRLSLLNNGREVEIEYGETANVRFKDF